VKCPYFLTVSGHIERIQSWNRYGGPFRKRRTCRQFHSNFISTKKVDRTSWFSLQTNHSCHLYRRDRILFPGVLERQVWSAIRGAERIVLTGQKVSSLPSDAIVTPFDYSRLLVYERTRRFYPNVLLIYVLGAWEFRLGRVWFNGDWLLLDRDGVFDYSITRPKHLAHVILPGLLTAFLFLFHILSHVLASSPIQILE